MTRRRKVWLILAVVAVIAVIGWLVLQRMAVDNPAISGAMDSLTALPYVQWSSVSGEEREKRGVVFHDAERSWAGLNIYCAESRPGGVVLNMEGRVVHSVVDRRKGADNCKLLEPLGDDRFLLLTVEGTLLDIDRGSRILRQKNLWFHHDMAVAEDGQTWTLIKQADYKPGIARLRPVLNHYIVILDDDWNEVRRISYADIVLRNPDLLKAVKTRRNQQIFDLTDNIFNSNTIEIIPHDVVRDGKVIFRKGHILVSWRNIDTIGVLDPDTEEFAWKWGPGELEHPHHPSLLENGNLLIFDNGKFRGSSRVIELDPVTEEIVWQYEADPPESFFSRSRGAAQRLPNGNTLITESTRGHVFEVTTEGDIVWDFWEPQLRKGFLTGSTERSTIYRMMRIPDPGASAAGS